MKLSDYLFQTLALHGVKHVFMVPGGGAMHLNDSLGRSEGIAFVSNHHEQASAIAAEAYARVTNNLGVALVTTGPGGTNAITGLAGAWQDSTPCLFLSGQVKRADLVGNRGMRQLGVQEIDIVSIVRPITKYAVTIMDPAMIRFHLEKAIHLAKSGRPGPVWIDIPLDVQTAEIDPGRLEGFTPPVPASPILAEPVTRLTSLLNEAERPVLLVGNGVRLAGALDELGELIELLGIPVLTTRLGVDLLSADHPLSMGIPGSIASRGANFTLQNADLLLILGARMDRAIIGYAPQNLARGAKKIMVDVDPAELQKLDPFIDDPIQADAGAFIRELLKVAIQPRDRSPWLARCRSWKAQYPFVLPEHLSSTGRVSIYAFAEVLSRELGPDCVVLPGNAGNSSELLLTAFKARRGQRIFHNKGTGAMGFCQPAAIGACLASGGRETICVDGDGGFQMNIQELETVKRLGLPIKFFVMNNEGYASIRASQRTYFGRLTGADASSGMTLPDYVRVAKAYGLSATRIRGMRDLQSGIRRVLAMPGPVLCDVLTIPDEPRAPRIGSRQRQDGTMISSPLEDLLPPLEREEFLTNMIVPPLED